MHKHFWLIALAALLILACLSGSPSDKKSAPITLVPTPDPAFLTQRAANWSATRTAVAPTPAPTDTPIPPPPPPTDTPIPQPTDTPIPPEAEPQPPQVDPELEQYREDMLANFDLLSTALINLSALSTNPQIGDPDWTTDTALQLVAIQMVYENVIAMPAPAEMTEFHGALTEALMDCYLMTDYYTSGVDNMNIDDINTATELMTSCGQKLETASETLP